MNEDAKRQARLRRPRGERRDDANAFVPDTVGQHTPIAVAEAEAFAEEFIGAATRGESVGREAEDELASDEDGGPFIALDEEAHLPPEEAEPESLGSEPTREPPSRGARWASRRS